MTCETVHESNATSRHRDILRKYKRQLILISHKNTHVINLERPSHINPQITPASPLGPCPDRFLGRKIIFSFRQNETAEKNIKLQLKEHIDKTTRKHVDPSEVRSGYNQRNPNNYLA